MTNASRAASSLFVVGEFIVLMRCPICKREFDPDASTSKPFCSERCRTIDLGRWLGETYGLPAMPDPEADETPEAELPTNGNGLPPPT
jgi:endogenous inhibitor of DNA gyrase (YacG/DUF329 family)